MKSRTVVILWLLAIVLGVLAYFVKFHSKEAPPAQTKLAPGDKLFEELPIRDIYSVQISQGDDITHLIRAEGNQWGVKERLHYSLRYDLLRDLLGSLNDLEVTQSYPSDKQYFSRFGLADEIKPEDNKEEYLGAIKVAMLDQSGAPIEEVYLGKFSGSRRVGGRFVRITGDDSGIYAVPQTFPGVTANPKNWLNTKFVQISNIQSIGVSAPADSSFTKWKVSRPTLQGQFTIDDMSENEVMRLTSTSSLRSLFHSSSFQDVLSDDMVAELSEPDEKLKRRATITTFDGLTYVLDFWPHKPKPKDPNADSRLPDAPPSYNLTIKVSADLSKQENVKLKLIDAEQFQGVTYQVSRYLIAALEKKRDDFVATKPSSANSP